MKTKEPKKIKMVRVPGWWKGKNPHKAPDPALTVQSALLDKEKAEKEEARK